MKKRIFEEQLKLYEVSCGLVNELSAFSCGIAPTGGDLVCARNSIEAHAKWCKYQAGLKAKDTLYGFRFCDNLDRESYPIKFVII